MRRLMLGVMLAVSALSGEAADVPEKGTYDLLQDATLSQPFTVFDQLLLSLDQKAREVAEHFRPEKNDFRSSNVERNVFSRVWYDKSIARTVIEFSLYVSGIDDPWRDVCAKRVQDIAIFGLGLPINNQWKPTALGFFPRFLGARLTSDDAQLANYKAFSDSIVVGLTFSLESGNRSKPLKFSRQCFWDNKTDQVSFREHKY